LSRGRDQKSSDSVKLRQNPIYVKERERSDLFMQKVMQQSSRSKFIDKTHIKMVAKMNCSTEASTHMDSSVYQAVTLRDSLP
jgi:hypothetical protein